MAKHTPGPWRFDGDLVLSDNSQRYGDDACVCQTFNFADEDFPNKDANGQLIAAAPDLYEALKLAAEIEWPVEPHMEDATDFEDTGYFAEALMDVLLKIQDTAKDALAKAEGNER